MSVLNSKSIRRFACAARTKPTWPCSWSRVDVDLATAPELEKELDFISAERSVVVVDLCETRFMDSTGARVLLAVHSALSRGIRVACKPADEPASTLQRGILATSGGGGIRTHGTGGPGSAIFKTAAFDHSATPPARRGY